MQDQKLAAAIAEGREIGVVGAEHWTEEFDGLVHEQLEVGSGHVRAVETGSAREEIPIPVNGDAKRLWPERYAFSSRSRDEARAARQPVPDEASFVPSRTGPNSANNVRI